MLEKLTPKEEVALAKQMIAQVAAHDYAALEPQLDVSLQSPDLHDKLEEVAKLIPAGEPKNIKTVGAVTTSMRSVTRYDLTFEYQYEHDWLIVNTLLERRDGKIKLAGMHFMPRKQSLAAENAFTLAGKSIWHYVVLALAVAIPLFMIYALVMCIRTKIPKRKWLWLIFIAVGLMRFQLNWTTGAWGIQPLAFQVLGSGFYKTGAVAPYIFSLSFPLGAVVFLLKRKSFKRQAAVSQD